MPHDLVEGKEITLEKEDFHYIVKVLRLGLKDKIQLFNETEEYISSVISISKKNITLKAEEMVNTSCTDVNKEVTLAFGIPKGDKGDLVVQKATELGVTQIWPIITNRSLVKLNENKIAKREQRLKRIAKEAVEQCGRLKVPKIEILRDVGTMAQKVSTEDIVIIPWEKEHDKSMDVQQIHNAKGRIVLFVGPEGGLESKEIEELANYKTISLGKRILRAETAAIVSTTMVMYILGELGG